MPRTPPTHGPHAAALKDATADRHRAVERRVDVRSAFASTEAYRGLLERFLGLYAPLHLALEGSLEPAVVAASAARLERLRSDIAALGGDPAAVPLGAAVPSTSDGARALGVRYVVEGSALGGEVLARLAERRLGLTAEHGAAFFSGDVADVDRGRWAELLAEVERRGEAGELDRIVAGALATFDAFDAWVGPGTDTRP